MGYIRLREGNNEFAQVSSLCLFDNGKKMIELRFSRFAIRLSVLNPKFEQMTAGFEALKAVAQSDDLRKNFRAHKKFITFKFGGNECFLGNEGISLQRRDQRLARSHKK